MNSAAVVPDFDVLEYGFFRLRFRFEMVTIDQFLFKRGKKTFGKRVVIAVTLSGHACRDSICFQFFPIIGCRILRSPIEMPHEATRA